MNDFDELLEETLWQEMNVEPPAGMKTRLASAIIWKSRRRAGRNGFGWLAGAAAVLAGVAALQGYRQRSLQLPPGEGVGPVSVRVAGLDLVKVAPVWTTAPVHPRHRQMWSAANGIAPIEVEHLVIQPLQLASLTSTNSVTE
jgi:hypothetical protein